MGGEFDFELVEAPVGGAASNGCKSGVGEQSFEVCLGSHGERAVGGAAEGVVGVLVGVGQWRGALK